MGDFNKLDQAMADFAQRSKASDDAKAAKQRAEDQFRDDFGTFRAITAWPVLEEIANRVRLAGHGAEVTMLETGVEPGIEIQVTPGQTKSHAYYFTNDDQLPRVTLRSVPSSSTVAITKCERIPGGIAASAEEHFTLEQLTAEQLRTIVIESIAKSFAA